MASYGWESLVPVHFPCHAGGRNGDTAIYGLNRFKIVVACGTLGGENRKTNKKGKYHGDFDLRDYILLHILTYLQNTTGTPRERRQVKEEIMICFYTFREQNART